MSGETSALARQRCEAELRSTVEISTAAYGCYAKQPEADDVSELLHSHGTTKPYAACVHGAGRRRYRRTAAS